ncbi:MAG: hypothetical protein CSA72_13050 [Rhodobacterales bacterium]|nr:MAG: hypothetical protein CSA72_13050 [Rhodobacterales bacterium]
MSLFALTAVSACLSTAPGPSDPPSRPSVRQAAPSVPDVPRAQAEAARVHVIRDNRGGQVLSALAERERLRRWGGPVEVRGYCASACTIFITLPNACLGRGAVVGFHAPSITGTDTIIPGTEGFLGAYYRNGILEKWRADWSRSTKITKIRAREYVELDPQTRLCD